MNLINTTKKVNTIKNNLGLNAMPIKMPMAVFSDIEKKYPKIHMGKRNLE